MKYKPHDYQSYCIQYLLTHPIAALFLDCGLGKTSITLSAINELLFDRFEVGKVLVVAPLRVANLSWPDEIKKFEDFHLISYSLVTGSKTKRIAALKQQANVYIINRENLEWLVEKSGMPFDFDMVVLDELSSFKNYQSNRFKSFMKVRPFVNRIVGLTGTPVPNGLMDLFAEIKVLDFGKRLGRFITQFRTEYFRPGKTNGQIVFNYVLLPGAAEQIEAKISDITISMKALDHLPMPEFISTEYTVSLDEKEWNHYRQLQNHLVLNYTEEHEITASNAGALSGKLCQMSNGAIYSDEKVVVPIHDKKLDALEDLIESSNGKPMLVAYWFQHDLERIEKRLAERKIPFSRLNTESTIRKWNEGKILVGLIHPASAGHGLNLQQGGHHLVWFGLTWSLELYQQTNARLWRQGQKHHTVIVQHIIAKDTIDEKILEALKQKNLTQEKLVEAVKISLSKKQEV